MEAFFDDPCYSIPSMLECKTVSIHIRNVIFIGFMLYSLYNFVDTIRQYVGRKESKFLPAVLFWLFGFSNVLVTQIILLNAKEFEQSPLKTFCWSLSSALDHAPFMFILNYFYDSFKQSIQPSFLYGLTKVISYVIIVVGFIPSIVYISVPENSSYDSTEKFIPHLITCLMTAACDTFFLFAMFRLFLSKKISSFFDDKTFKRYRIGIISLSFVLFLRVALLLVGSVPHYSYRLFFFLKDPDNYQEIFAADYCAVDLIVYMLPYVFLAIILKTKSSVQDEPSPEAAKHTSKISIGSFEPEFT